MQRVWNELGGLVILLVTGLALALAFVVWMVIHRLRRPPRRTYASCVARGEPGDPGELATPRKFERVDRVLGGVRIECWDIEGDAPGGGAIVIVTPGWGDSKVGVLPRLGALAAHARTVVAWDPPGFGETEGLCALGTKEDVLLRDLVEQVRAGHEEGAPVVFYGWSLGAGAGIVAGGEGRASSLGEATGIGDQASGRKEGIAAEGGRSERARESDVSFSPQRAQRALSENCGRAESGMVACVIAEAPYRQAWTPAFRVMRLAGLPWRVNGPIAFALLGLRLGQGVWWKNFDRAKWAKKVRVPLVVIHGTEDEISPFEDGKAIATAAEKGELRAIEGAHHNDLWGEEFGGRTSEAVREVIGKVVHRGVTK